MGSKSNRKGKVGEREFAKFLRKRGIHGAHRGAQHKGGPDSPDVAGLEGFHVEVKRTEALRLYPALAQATAEAAPGEVPIVAHRRSRCPWVVILDAEDFVRLVT